LAILKKCITHAQWAALKIAQSNRQNLIRKETKENPRQKIKKIKIKKPKIRAQRFKKKQKFEQNFTEMK
jgi:hypothetical protein